MSYGHITKKKKSKIAGFYCSAMCRIDVSYYRFFKEKKTHKSKRRKKYEGIIFFSRNFLKTLFFLCILCLKTYGIDHICSSDMLCAIQHWGFFLHRIVHYWGFFLHRTFHMLFYQKNTSMIIYVNTWVIRHNTQQCKLFYDCDRRQMLYL